VALIWFLENYYLPVNSPTHKRTEGRAPVWGSKFTSKEAIIQGESSKNRIYAPRKILGYAWLVVVASYGFLAQSSF
jgi:hypothetical protein